MDLDLSGKTAVVCGSTQGIGWSAALELSQLGARVFLMARNEEKLEEKVKKLEGDVEHGYLVADFTDPKDVKSAIETLIDEYGPVHILVNNTGGPPGGRAIDAGLEEYESAFQQHLICNQVLAQALSPGMKHSGYGRIVNVISTSVKQPLPNLGVSNTVRGAVANWSKTLANELGPDGITVNNVLPGPTDTSRLQSIAERKAGKAGTTPEEERKKMASQVPLRRVGKPEEVGAAIAFLCSPAAGYINGINVPVDGGRTGCL